MIEAEAALKGGQTTTWLAKHNEARATVAGLGAMTDPGTDAARVDKHFYERGFWFWGTGHRLGDLRRMVRQYGRTAESLLQGRQLRDELQHSGADPGNQQPERGDQPERSVRVELSRPESVGAVSRTQD